MVSSLSRGRTMLLLLSFLLIIVLFLYGTHWKYLHSYRKNRQVLWVLKMQALTERQHVDDIEAEENGIAETCLDNETLAESARPGTSLRFPGTSQGGAPTHGYR